MRYPRQYYLLHFQCTLRIYCYINHLLYDMYRKARSAPNSDIALRPTEIPESRRYCGGKKGCVLAFRLRLDSDRATKIACTITKGKQDEMKPRSLCWFVVLLSRLVHNTHSININGWAHAGGKKASQGERGPAVAEDWRWSRALMSGQLWVGGGAGGRSAVTRDSVSVGSRPRRRRGQRADSAPRMHDGLYEWLCVAGELRGPVDYFITLLWPNKTNLSPFIRVKVT